MLNDTHSTSNLSQVVWRSDLEACWNIERLKQGNVHKKYVILLPFQKLTFRYNSMLNFIQVSFCFLLFWGLGLGLGFRV